MQAVADPCAVRSYLLALQNKLCRFLEAEDGQGTFREDSWRHLAGGGGVTCILEDGVVFEKAGVNFSDVTGEKLPAAATEQRPELDRCGFRAMGVSLVVHPRNPWVPTTHANVRFFQTRESSEHRAWWFGGGFDLTPYYGFEEDAVHWHRTARSACDPFGLHLYPCFKAACDRYFYNAHRREARGIGGLFFDDFNEGGFHNSFGLMRSIGDHLIPAYQPIVTRRKNHPYSEAQRAFQLYRRGRYVEFNLLYDRGTRFGLESGGRVESILMSLPPLVRWDYNSKPEPHTSEAQLYRRFLQPRDWLSNAESDSYTLADCSHNEQS